MSMIFILWTEKVVKNLSELQSLLIKDGWNVINSVGSSLSSDLLKGSASGSDKNLVCLAILDPVDYIFSASELQQIHKFFITKNSLILASSDNESATRKSNINKISIRFGVRFNDDCVIRPNLYKYYHPKEALLEDFIANRGIGDTIKKYINPSSLSLENEAFENETRVIYPRGCTLQVNKTSVIMMTSSKWNLPNGQAICTFYRDSNSSRVVCLGSTAIMSDDYLKLENNKALICTLLEFIVNKHFLINFSDSKTIEVPDPLITPDINQLADVPISIIQESEPLPNDKLSLIDGKLFSIDSSLLPTIIRAYQDLNVDNEPLTLMRPVFERKKINLEPALHGFLLRR